MRGHGREQGEGDPWLLIARGIAQGGWGVFIQSGYKDSLDHFKDANWTYVAPSAVRRCPLPKAEPTHCHHPPP